jgi:hypothetical protein
MSFFACRLPATSGHRAMLEALDLQGLIAFDHVYEAAGQLSFALTADELEVVRAHGLDPELVADLAQVAAGRLAERADRARDDSDDAPTTGFVDQYLDAAEVAARIAALAAEFPALCQLTTLPEQTEGYDGSVPALVGPADVQLLRLTDDPSDRSRPALLLVCGTHAREWVNPLIALELAEQLVRNYDPASSDLEILAITRILQEGEVLIVPVLNPDGLNYSIHDAAGWRKNRRANPSAPACPGVDNNRNYEIFFGEAGASGMACSDTYRGPFAFSERENRNLRFIAESFPNILIAVDSHSAGEQIFRPTATGGSFVAALPVAPEDELIYQQLEAAANAAIQAVSGKTYATGTTSNHAGTSDEYLFFAHRVFAFDFECALDFQPPIAMALVSVQEVTAALMALALAAIDLEVAATVPARIIQAIDRTGSMVAFGYDGAARANARRFVDLMSIGDQVSLVSFADPSPDPSATPFADRARVDVALSELTPASLVQVRAVIDALAFGGWTSLGAGLQTAAGELAAGTTPRDAIVLLSDGFENREPWTADVLATFPPGIRVFTIALGGQADAALLQQIATDTGGSFHLSPTSLELYEVYNQIRADASDDDLVLNAVVQAEGDEDAAPDLWVEQGVARLLVSVAHQEGVKTPRLSLIDPYGRRLRRGDWGFEAAASPGHLTLRVARPVPGRWRIAVSGQGRYVVAAFVRSPIRVGCTPVVLGDRQRRVIALGVAARSGFAGGLTLEGVGLSTQTAAWRPKVASQSLEWLDAAGAELRAHCGELQVQGTAQGVRAHATLHADPVRVKQGRFLSEHAAAVEYLLPFPHSVRPGVYTIAVRLSGSFARFGRFERVVRASAVVQP